MPDLRLFEHKQKGKKSSFTAEIGRNYLKVTIEKDNQKWSITKSLLGHINDSKIHHLAKGFDRIKLLVTPQMTLIRPLYETNFYQKMIKYIISQKKHNNFKGVPKVIQLPHFQSLEERYFGVAEVMKQIIANQIMMFDSKVSILDHFEKPIHRCVINRNLLLKKIIERYMKRRELIKELDEILVCTWSRDEFVRLDYDSTIQITENLSNEDLENFIQAFKFY